MRRAIETSTACPPALRDRDVQLDRAHHVALRALHQLDLLAGVVADSRVVIGELRAELDALRLELDAERALGGESRRGVTP